MFLAFGCYFIGAINVLNKLLKLRSGQKTASTGRANARRLAKRYGAWENLMNIAKLFLLFATCSLIPHVSASEKVEYSQEAAIKYAQAAILEQYHRIKRPFDRGALEKNPLIYSGIDINGRKIIMVLFKANKGAYDVFLTQNKDGIMSVVDRGHFFGNLDELISQFEEAPFVIGE